MLIAALFTIARIWKQPKCPSIDEWIKEFTCAVEYNSAIKRMKIFHLQQLRWTQTVLCCAVLSRSVVSDSSWPHGLQPSRLLCPWGFSRQEYWSCHDLLQGIFPTQGSNPGIPHCRWIPYYLSHQGSPRTLEWVTHPFSRGSSAPRNWTGISCIAGRFFTSWATREAQTILWCVK